MGYEGRSLAFEETRVCRMLCRGGNVGSFVSEELIRGTFGVLLMERNGSMKVFVSSICLDIFLASSYLKAGAHTLTLV